MPPTKPRRGRPPSQANRHLGNSIEQRGFGALSDQRGFILARDPDVLPGPDLAVVRGDRVPTDDDAYPFLAPDPLVPVVRRPVPSGPSIDETIAHDRASGLRLVWALDPGWRTLRLRRPGVSDRVLVEHEELDGEEMLPSFRLPVARFFAQNGGRRRYPFVAPAVRPET